MDKEIINGNALIAEFISDSAHKYSNDGDFITTEICGGSGEAAYYDYDKMKFHTSWDWLMPVCIKLNMSYIYTDINMAYYEVLEKIKYVAFDT